MITEVQSETVQHFTGGPESAGQPSEKPLSIEETAGIPTGIAPDIKKQIARRQKRAPLSDTPIPPPDGFTYNPGNAPAQADADGRELAAVAVVTTDEQEAPPAGRAPDNLA